MTHVDFLILGIVVISMIIGYFRGFFPEVVAVATWVIAALGGIHFSHVVQPYLTGKMGSEVVELWAARAIVFVLIMIVGGLIGQLVSLLVDKAGLSGTDKTLGVAFGLIRGAIVVGVLVIFAQLIGFSSDPWWKMSKLVPYGETVADGIRSLLPDKVSQYIEERELEQDPGAPADDLGLPTLDEAREAVGGVDGG
jgi:membrane protein required for colicin V production